MWQQYWPWLVAITALIIALLGALLRIRSRQFALMKISGRNRLLLASARKGICGAARRLRRRNVGNRQQTKLSDYAEELIGKNLHALTRHRNQTVSPIRIMDARSS